MPDEHQQPPEPVDPWLDSDPANTRPMDAAEDTPEPGATLPAGGEPQPDSGHQPDSGRQSGWGETTEQPAPPGVGPGGTGILPPTPQGPADETPRWSARASVPLPAAPPITTDTATWTEPPRGGRMHPALFATAAIILLLLLGLGVYLIVHAASAGEPPQPSQTTPAPATTPAPSTTAATTTAVTTTVPPNTTAPPLVAVPPLAGLDYQNAIKRAADAGLFVTPVQEASDTVAAGKIIRTEPDAGAQVAPGTAIKVVVSSGPANPPTTTPAATSPSPTA